MSNTTKVRYLSSTNLSKEMFERLLRSTWIDRVEEQWVLTEKGKEKDGQLKSRGDRQWIAWPESIMNDFKLKEINSKEKFLSTTN